MQLTPRRRYLVDPQVQKSLLLRACCYWCGCVLAVGLTLLIVKGFTGPPRPFMEFFDYDWLWQQHGIILFGAAMTLPLVLIDVMLTSNRLAGPIYRMRRSMRALAAGEYVQPIEFRGGDFWHEVAEEFNSVAKYVEQLKKEARNARSTQADTIEAEAVVKSV